ncbi:MAG: DUF3293 domain-containing protein [Ferrovum sp.]|nr:DUF3293 domain-containing protein [Ferrovum sp.]
MSITESTTISPELLRIYRASDYRVTDEEGREFVMHVDEPSSMLGALMARHGAQGAVFVSAYNPASEPRTEAENQAAQARLKQEIVAQGYRIFAGVGEDPDGGCPGEPCFLVLDWPREKVLALGQVYGQNALLWAGTDAVPRLILTR